MGAITSREVRLAARPDGWPKPGDFELAEVSVPEPGDGQVLVRNLYMSVDPYMRGRMNPGPSYAPPYEIGAPMYGGALGRIEVSRHPGFTEGDHVTNQLGWRECFISDGSGLNKVEPAGVPLSAYLGVLGMPGLTAYVGILDIGQAKAGQIVFVSGAAGAVGSIAGQVARVIGCRVIGSAGSDEKVAWLRDDLGFDAAFNYKTTDLEAIELYFDNVGGDHLQAALNHLKPFGRIAACGSISQYNNATPAPGPNNLSWIVRHRLTMQGYIISDHAHRMPDFLRDMSGWLREGKVKNRETVVDGIEHAVDAFLGMMRGENMGKMVVRLAPDE
jgi:NADPH-dependent curcumin reductase CurA